MLLSSEALDAGSVRYGAKGAKSSKRSKSASWQMLPVSVDTDAGSVRHDAKGAKSLKGAVIATELASVDLGLRTTPQLQDCEDLVQKPEPIEASSKRGEKTEGVKEFKEDTWRQES